MWKVRDLDTFCVVGLFLPQVKTEPLIASPKLYISSPFVTVKCCNVLRFHYCSVSYAFQQHSITLAYCTVVFWWLNVQENEISHVWYPQWNHCKLWCYHELMLKLNLTLMLCSCCIVCSTKNLLLEHFMWRASLCRPSSTLDRVPFPLSGH